MYDSLLVDSSKEEFEEYFHQLTSTGECFGLRVADAGVDDRGCERGKGLFATRDFNPGDVVLIEPPLVAAQVVASTALLADKERVAVEDEGGSGGQWWWWELPGDPKSDAALLKAWTRYRVGWKRIWWECVALPDDVDPEDEPVFRGQMQSLAQRSLELLSAALPQCAERYPALFSLDVYGSIIGLFELNNLALVVASPVEDYFIHISDLPSGPDKDAADAVTQPLLDALDTDYDIPCEGTGYYAIQACVNHSCGPNTHAFKRDQDVDGRAVLLAKTAIAAGEEITISYVNEEEGLKARRAALADYGFLCRCERCISDDLKRKAKQAKLKKKSGKKPA
eukprot:gene10851-12837_t